MEPRGHEQDWAAPLVAELKLTRRRTETFDRAALWDRLKAHELPERVRRAVVRLNHELNDTVLEYLEYLPPQATVVRVAYHRKGQTLVMELVLREEGPKVVFYRQKTYGSLLRSLLRRDRSRLDVVLVRRFKPEALPETEIQDWFSFLLSGFKRLPASGLEKGNNKSRVSDVTEVA